MTRTRRTALFAAALALLSAAAVLVARGGPGAPAVVETTQQLSGAGKPEPVRELAARALERSAERHREAKARRENPQAEAAPPRSRLSRRVHAPMEAVARAFFRAFARYEFGALSAAVRVELRETTTAAFARELLGEPPRMPPGPPLAEPARLSNLQLVPEVAGGRRLAGAWLLGYTIRGARREPITISMRREEGRWRVAALGR
jgi:hypothetical protein